MDGVRLRLWAGRSVETTHPLTPGTMVLQGLGTWFENRATCKPRKSRTVRTGSIFTCTYGESQRSELAAVLQVGHVRNDTRLVLQIFVGCIGEISVSLVK